MNPQWVQAAAGIIAAFAALFGGIYAVVTRPIENRFTDLGVTLKVITDRLKRIEDTLERIETKLGDHAERITRLEAGRWK